MTDDEDEATIRRMRDAEKRRQDREREANKAKLAKEARKIAREAARRRGNGKPKGQP